MEGPLQPDPANKHWPPILTPIGQKTVSLFQGLNARKNSYFVLYIPRMGVLIREVSSFQMCVLIEGFLSQSYITHYVVDGASNQVDSVDKWFHQFEVPP